MVTASISASFLYVGVAVGGPLIGWLDGATTWRRDMMIMNIFCAAILLFAIIFWISSPLWVVSTLMFFSGCFASSYVLTFAIANEIATPANRATSIGFTNMLCVVFAPILQPLVGFLIIHWDDHPSIHHGVARSLPHFQWALSVIPVLLIASAFIAYFLPKKE